MSVLVDALERILRNRITLHPQIAHDLQPGLTRREILHVLRKIPYQIPGELVELYSWRNGSVGGDALFSAYEFGPLDFSLRMYELTMALQARHPERPSWYAHSFPMMGCNGDVELAIVLDHDNYTAPIQCIDMEMDICEQRFDSLTTMALTIAACFEAGVYRWTEDDLIGENYDKYVELHARYNVHSVPGPNMFGDE